MPDAAADVGHVFAHQLAHQIAERTAKGGIGGGLKHDCLGRFIAGHRGGVQGDARRKILGAQRERTAEVAAPRLNDKRETIAARDHDVLARLGVVAAGVQHVQAQLGHAGLELHAIGVVRAAVAEVVADAQGVLAIGGNGPTDVAVGPAGVVIAGEVAAVLVANVHNCIDGRPQFAGVHAHVETLPLFCGEPKPILVALGLDDAVECEWQRRFDEARFAHGIVRLGLEFVGERRYAHLVARRRHHASRLREDRDVAETRLVLLAKSGLE